MLLKEHTLKCGAASYMWVLSFVSGGLTIMSWLSLPYIVKQRIKAGLLFVCSVQLFLINLI